MTSLTGPSRPAASGTADSLVVFLHGYGADGADLIGLAEPLAPHLPNTRFLAPNAPQRCVNNPFGYQWFPIPWLDGTPEAVAEALARSQHAGVAAQGLARIARLGQHLQPAVVEAGDREVQPPGLAGCRAPFDA